VKDVEQMDVFKLAHGLALEVYRLTAAFPKEEIYGLTAQMRRAATSVPANIMEGANRDSRVEYRRFVGISRGSAGEVRYYLLLAMDLQYLSTAEGQRLRQEYVRVIQMLTNLSKSLGGRRNEKRGRQT
jgi:four helix bundle protein